MGLNFKRFGDPHQQTATDRATVVFDQIKVGRRNPRGLRQGILGHADIFSPSANAVPDGCLTRHTKVVPLDIIYKFSQQLLIYLQKKRFISTGC